MTCGLRRNKYINGHILLKNEILRGKGWRQFFHVFNHTENSCIYIIH